MIMTEDLSRYTKSQDVGYIKITPKIKRLADKITNGSKTDREKVERIYDFIRSKEYFISPTTYTNELIEREWLDCGSKHALFASLNRSLGIPTRIALMECPMEGFQNTLDHIHLPKGMSTVAKSLIHAFGEDILGGTHYASEVYLDGDWEFMDATMNPRLCKLMGKDNPDKHEKCLSKENVSGVLECRKIGQSEDVPSNGIILSTLARMVTDLTGATKKIRKMVEKGKKKTFGDQGL